MRTQLYHLRRRGLIAFLACLAFGPACVSDGDDDDDSSSEATNAPFTLYVSNNGTANEGNVDQFNQDFGFRRLFVAGNNEGVVADIAGNLCQAGDVQPFLAGGGAPGSIRFISAIRIAPDNTAFDDSCDRELGGPGTMMTGLVDPKGITIAHLAGYVFVANHLAAEITVFGTAAHGDVSPFATTSVSGAPWDVAYDEITDRLFVAMTEGTIHVYDNYILNGFGQGPPDRVIVPSDGIGQTSTNLHGIAYDFATDAIIVTDVGAANAGEGPNFASDGSLHVFFGGSIADGMTVPSRSISGPSTLLGNPVDCLLTDDDLLVAEKANDFLLRFRSIYSGASGDIAPEVSSTEIKPESLGGENEDQNGNVPRDPDVSDIDNPGTLILSIATTSNPPALDPAFGEYARITTDLSLQLGTADLDSGLGGLTFSLENVTFDATGDAFVTFDDGADANGGVLVANRLSRARGGPITASRDRVLSGLNTTLVSPKGIEIVGSRGWMLIAENTAATPGIVGFGTQAGGDVPPGFTTDLTGIGRPWDLDYDPEADRLFVSLTNGSVAVFDQYSMGMGARGPDRIITPADGKIFATDLRGIVYVAPSDTLFLSDVGDVGDSTDGQILVIENAATANGPTVFARRFTGPSTMLGNPVDLAFDGANLYVAEKANDLILRFDDALSAGGDVAPDQQIARTQPESVCLIPAFLSRTPGF